MLSQRVLVVVVLLPLWVGLLFWGTVPFAFFMALVLVLAAREYGLLFQAGGYRPAAGILMLGVAGLAWAHIGDRWTAPWLLGVVFGAAAWHLIAYERGREQAGTDFAVTLSGILYLGYLGAYLLKLRFLEYGIWWVLLVLPIVWIADSAAYFVGRRYGKHPLSPRLSPKKTWEGYWGGVLGGILGGCLLATAYGTLWGVAPLIRPWHGVVLGVILGIFTPLGDLTESMFKRQFGVKDSSHLLPGHGGAWDRIDSWLWAAPLGYYLIVWLFT